MWHPGRSQWIVIWTTFAVALYCFFWGNQTRWTASDLLEPREYRTLGWFALGGGALGVWFLQGRRNASPLVHGEISSPHQLGASADSKRTVSTGAAENFQQPKQPSAAIITVAAGIAAIWAVLILVAYAAGTATGSLAATIGSAVLSAAYALALFRRHARALDLSWLMVVLLGLATFLGGLVPLMIGIWALLLGFTLYLRKHRDVLRRGSARSTGDRSAV
jgi:hypothetical protein